MYGGMDRNANPTLKGADDKLIEDTTRQYGSREKASAAFVNNGFIYYNRDDLSNAMRRFNQAWLLDPNNAEVYWGFGAVLIDQDKACESMKFHERALSFGRYISGLYPDAGRVITECAVVDKSIQAVQRAKLFERADLLYTEATQKDVNKGYVYASWAVAYFMREQYGEAWQMVHKARDHGGKVSNNLLSRLRERMPEP